MYGNISYVEGLILFEERTGLSDVFWNGFKILIQVTMVTKQLG